MTYGRVDWHRLQESFEPPPPLTTRGILRLADMVGPTLQRIAQCGRLPDPFAPIRLLGDDGRLEIRVGLSILQKTVFLFTFTSVCPEPALATIRVLPYNGTDEALFPTWVPGTGWTL